MYILLSGIILNNYTMKKIIFLLLSFAATVVFAQSVNVNGEVSEPDSDKKLLFGGYAQIEYLQPIVEGEFNNGKLDIHRLVLLMRYNFNDRISFMSEIEIEHASEIYLEQAYLNYRFYNWLQLRAGLLLIPMGIINENHEPPTFNGVLRPSIDKYIVPTTWREIGIGFTGKISQPGIRYSVYVINGVLGYKDGARLDGESGIRKGRQKGISSMVGSPSLTSRIEYYGVRNLKIGLSYFGGSTQTSLNADLSKDDMQGIDTRDSSIVDMSMWGIDARYNIHGFRFRTQYNYVSFSNTKAYNDFTDSDLGESMFGFYIEAAYNVFHAFKMIKHELIPFVRYENYNTQDGIDDLSKQNDAFHREEITAGIGWKPVYNVALKCDYQLKRTKLDQNFQGMLNLGVGVMF